MEELHPDVIIFVTGSHPFVPGIKGIEDAKHVIDVYEQLEAIKDKKIVIIGGGAIGCETGGRLF